MKLSKVREIAQKVLGDVLDVSVVGGFKKSIKRERARENILDMLTFQWQGRHPN